MYIQCRRCGKQVEIPDNRYKYCPECKDPTLKERAHKYYLIRKAKNPEREKELRLRSRKNIRSKTGIILKQFKEKIPRKQCLILKDEKEVLHHKYYKNKKELNTCQQGNWKGTIKRVRERLDTPKRYRILSKTTHRILTGMLQLSEEDLDKLYLFAKEDRELRKKHNPWL